jgi:hemerythrin-like domain-containing protein
MMLLATYALLTLSIEQKEERRLIARIRSYVAKYQKRPNEIDPGILASQLDKLGALAELHHKEKLEECLIPAVREASTDAAPLLDNLASLRRTGRAMLCVMRRSLRLAARNGQHQVENVIGNVEGYCQNLLERLAKEEYELLPLARRVIHGQGWFAIGAAFLAQDARHEERRRHHLAIG